MLKSRQDKFVKTTDDWHPNFLGDTIKVILCLQEWPAGYYDVCLRAWGADDFALTLDKNGIKSFKEALAIKEEFGKIYDAVPEVADKDWFYKQGFEQF